MKNSISTESGTPGEALSHLVDGYRAMEAYSWGEAHSWRLIHRGV